MLYSKQTFCSHYFHILIVVTVVTVVTVVYFVSFSVFDEWRSFVVLRKSAVSEWKSSAGESWSRHRKTRYLLLLQWRLYFLLNYVNFILHNYKVVSFWVATFSELFHFYRYITMRFRCRTQYGSSSPADKIVGSEARRSDLNHFFRSVRISTTKGTFWSFRTSQ